MKKATKLIAGAVLGILLMAGQASAAVKGEIGVKGIGVDNTATTQHRLREYSTLPADASVSLFNLDANLFHKGNLLRFRGADLGEDNAEAALTLVFGKWLTTDESISKVPHNIAAGSGTERLRDSLSMHFLPLSKLNLFVSATTEDKVGLLDDKIIDSPFTLAVSQKTERGIAGINATLWNLDFTGSAGKQQLSESNGWSHEADLLSLALSLRPRSQFWAIASYDSKEYSAYWNSAATNTVKVESAELAAQYVVNNRLTLDGGYENNKRGNDRAASPARAREIDENVMGASFNYTCPRGGTLSVSYKSQDRDLSGSGVAITNRKTDTLDVKASTKLSFLKVRAGYKHGNREISGFTASSVLPAENFYPENMSGEFSENTISVSLLGFKYFNLTASNVAKHNSFNPSETYGVHSNNTLNRGMTATYEANDELSLNAAVYNLRNRVFARELYNAVDKTTSVTNGTNYMQLGAAFRLSESSTLSADLINTHSSVNDVLGSNTVRERTFSVGLDRQLTKAYSASAQIARNTYTNALETGYSPKSTLFSLELRKKF